MKISMGKNKDKMFTTPWPAIMPSLYLYRSLGRRKKIYDCKLTGHNTLSDMDRLKSLAMSL